MTHTGADRPSPRYLIVNADDLGLGRGVNDGIAEAHDRGLVTSASLMVTRTTSAAGARIAASRPLLSVGLHVDLTGEGEPRGIDLDDAAWCRREIDEQFRRFEDLLQRSPSHLDAHHNVFRLPALESVFVAAALERGVPLREHSIVTYFPDFYGQWDDGETHLEWIAPDNLVHLLETRVGAGVTELSCHPGRIDPALRSPYHRERAAELARAVSPGGARPCPSVRSGARQLRPARGGAGDVGWRLTDGRGAGAGVASSCSAATRDPVPPPGRLGAARVPPGGLCRRATAAAEAADRQRPGGRAGHRCTRCGARRARRGRRRRGAGAGRGHARLGSHPRLLPADRRGGAVLGVGRCTHGARRLPRRVRRPPAAPAAPPPRTGRRGLAQPSSTRTRAPCTPRRASCSCRPCCTW